MAADTPCGGLIVEQRQVEIIRGAGAGTRCLPLDEPTAALERGAVRRLFDQVRQLREVGVLRDGELVLTAPMAEVSKEDLVTAMVGSPERARPSRAGACSCPGGAARPGRTGAFNLVVSSVAAVSADTLLAASRCPCGEQVG